MAEETKSGYGCSHYDRRAKLVAPCCEKVYDCRFCHDETEDHILNRQNVVQLVCAVCNTRQDVSTNCVSCQVKFGNYSCLVCRLYDNKDKQQFHCNECGICRIGGRKNFFHCKTCGFCLLISLQFNHKCIVDASRQDCPICLDDLHITRIPVQLLKCGHVLHTKCYNDLIMAGHYNCPLCRSE